MGYGFENWDQAFTERQIREIMQVIFLQALCEDKSLSIAKLIL
jgi:hypothetical protein